MKKPSKVKRIKKLAAAQKKEVYRTPDDWTKTSGSETNYSGGMVPKRNTGWND